MYIESKRRAYWDQFADQFISSFLCAHKTPPSQSGLTYLLSRIIWAIYNKFPSAQVGSGLCAVLADVRAEFIRRKLSIRHELDIDEQGDLPEAKNCACDICGTTTGILSGGPNIQQLPKSDVLDLNNLPPGCKVVSMEDVQKCLAEGKSLHTLMEPTTPVDPASQTGAFVKDANFDKVKWDGKLTVTPGADNLQAAAVGLPPVPEPVKTEADHEAALLRAMKAYSIARKSNATPYILKNLEALVRNASATLFNLYGEPI